MYSACLKIERVLSSGIGGDGKSTCATAQAYSCGETGGRARTRGRQLVNRLVHVPVEERWIAAMP